MTAATIRDVTPGSNCLSPFLNFGNFALTLVPKQERHQIKPLLLSHILVVLRSTLSAGNVILEHSWQYVSILAVRCCARSRGTQDSSRVCSTVRCKFRSRLEIMGTSITLICSHILPEFRSRGTIVTTSTPSLRSWAL